MNNDEKTHAPMKNMPAVEFLKSSGATGRFVPPPPRGYVEVLAREFNVSTRAVSMALQGLTMTRLAIQIRNKYMQKYVEPYL